MLRYALFTIWITIFILGVSPVYGGPGKEMFAQKCLNCHINSEETEVVNPVDKASMQWRRFFKRHKHNRFKDISELLTPEDKQQILEYLVDHASDSDQPEIAGVR